MTDSKQLLAEALNGRPQRYWKAELARRSERREAWKEREAQEDEFTAYINALDDAKPQR